MQRLTRGKPPYLTCPISVCHSVWSLGVIVHILLVGYPPFFYEDEAALRHAILHDPVVFVEDDWEDVSHEGRDLILRMLERDPHERITAAQILKHPFARARRSSLSTANMSPMLEKLRKFNARRRLKGAMTKVRTAVRLKGLLRGLSNASLSSTGSASSETVTATPTAGGAGSGDGASSAGSGDSAISPGSGDGAGGAATVSRAVSASTLDPIEEDSASVSSQGGNDADADTPRASEAEAGRPELPALPEGWVKLHNSTGKSYYHNASTMDASWDPPT